MKTELMKEKDRDCGDENIKSAKTLGKRQTRCIFVLSAACRTEFWGACARLKLNRQSGRRCDCLASPYA